MSCKIDWCERPVKALGYCNCHYLRQRQGRDMNLPHLEEQARLREEKVCDYDLCDKPIFARGLCSVHYSQWRNGKRALCHIEGCFSRQVAFGLCPKHRWRWAKFGDPYWKGKNEPDDPKWRGGVYKRSDGYTRIRDLSTGSSELEHRLIMERILGRPLSDRENVHHKNGRRSDNRPENLELWTKPQPVGQRVKDLVDWVIENYRTELEAALGAEENVA